MAGHELTGFLICVRLRAAKHRGKQGIPKKSKPLHKDYRSQFKGGFRDQTGAKKSRLCLTQQLGRNVRPIKPLTCRHGLRMSLVW